mmetsp:Transcript_12412/g.26947  ORF Transcript_12412/g.26947 Transcript_12412/m.26947 type:complete len:103 (-) Transcript_12412:527-835(-)
MVARWAIDSPPLRVVSASTMLAVMAATLAARCLSASKNKFSIWHDSHRCLILFLAFHALDPLSILQLTLESPTDFRVSNPARARCHYAFFTELVDRTFTSSR